jgi:hypothetical protein
MATEIIHTVFISSTYEDLREERAEVQTKDIRLRCAGGTHIRRNRPPGELPVRDRTISEHKSRRGLQRLIEVG